MVSCRRGWDCRRRYCCDRTRIVEGVVTVDGIEADAVETYQLVGFDGNISISKSVRVDLIIGRKTFKGRFLLTDQASGVLGRDVINHLCLVLYGPRLTWEEQKNSGHV